MTFFFRKSSIISLAIGRRVSLSTQVPATATATASAIASTTTRHLDAMIKFAKFAYSEKGKTFFNETITKQEEDIQKDKGHVLYGQVRKLVAMKLDKDMVWPTFFESSHRYEKLPYVYFHRYGGVDSQRFEMTLSDLKSQYNSRNVCWFGPPGTGKSSAVNYILFELLANLGSQHFPEKVYYRSPIGGVFTFVVEKNDIEVTLKRKWHLDSVVDFVNEDCKGNKNACLILELGEGEKDPSPFIKTLVTTSTNNTLDTINKLYKGGARLLLAESPTKEQMYYSEQSRNDEGQKLWYMTSKSTLHIEAWKRINIIGPVPQAFGNRSSFNQYKDILAKTKQQEFSEKNRFQKAGCL